MKKELEFDVKRMLNLFESKLGNVKTIVEGGSYNEIREDAGTDAMTKLTRVELGFKDFGCERTSAANDALLPGEATNAFGKVEWMFPNLVVNDKPIKASQTELKPDTLYVPMQCNDGFYAVTNIIAPNDPKQLIVLKKIGEGSNAKYEYAQKEFPGLLQRAKSYMEDDRNLNADQIMIRDRILSKKGINLTGAQFTVVEPTGDETNNYEPVDLATGKGVASKTQFLDPTVLNPGGLDDKFKREGRYYLWVRKAAKEVKTDAVTNVENMLAKMGYTLNPNKLPDFQPGSDVRLTPDGGMITMETLCANGLCDQYDDLINYRDKFGGANIKLYPFKVGGGTRDIVAANVSRRKARKDIKSEAGLDANRKTCRALIDIYDNIINKGLQNDANIASIVSSLYPTTTGGVPNAMRVLGKTLKSCTEAWRNIRLSKDDLAKIDTFVNSSNKYAPNAAEVQKAAAKAKEEEEANNASGVGPKSALSESISRTLRKVLKEHTKTNSDYMIKKSVRKNLRRLL